MLLRTNLVFVEGRYRVPDTNTQCYPEKMSNSCIIINFIARQYLFVSSGTGVMRWSSKSPDFNWTHLGQIKPSCATQPAYIRNTIYSGISGCNNIPQVLIHPIIVRSRRLIQSVIYANGGQTRHLLFVDIFLFWYSKTSLFCTIVLLL